MTPAPSSFPLGAWSLLQAAPRAIGLLERCRARNAPALTRALARAVSHGERLDVRPEFGPPAQLPHLRTRLEQVAQVALALADDSADALMPLLAGRALELALEAQLAESVGSAAFCALATRRYPTPERTSAAHGLAEQWARLVEPSPLCARVASHDASDSASLLSLLRQVVRESGLPLEVQVEPRLMSTAATGPGQIFVRPGVGLTREQGRRIALHELLGHALPRLNAERQECALFRTGTKTGVETEEGRALRLERVAGLADTERRRELGFRHLGAFAIRHGADLVETARSLCELGCSAEQAAATTIRVARGGGLCRELGYLPHLLALDEALALAPDTEHYLQCGSVSLDAVAVLRRQVVPHPVFHVPLARFAET